jgi:hypothetical protein
MDEQSKFVKSQEKITEKKHKPNKTLANLPDSPIKRKESQEYPPRFTMQYLHDHYNHTEENDDGLQAIIHAAACSSQIEHLLFEANMHTPAPQTVIPDIRFFSLVLDIEKDLINNLKAQLACTHLPRHLERETKMNAYLAASLAEVAKPQRIRY